MSLVTMVVLALVTMKLPPAAAGPAAGRTAEASGSDLDRLQGSWTGRAGGARSIPVTIEFRRAEVSVTVRPPVGPAIRATGKVRLDPSAAPKSVDWFDFTRPDGEAIPEIAGIYEVAGDTLRICTGGLNNPRPTAFEPGEGMLADVLTFRRSPAATARTR